MASNGTPEPFASNELVGDRSLIAKPAPPPGLILGRPLKKQAPISQEPQAVFDSQPVFKRATPVRMLGDMVCHSFHSFSSITKEICSNWLEMAKNWIYFSHSIHRYGLLKRGPARRTTLSRSHPGLSAVSPRTTRNSSAKISCRPTSPPTELHPVPSILDWKRERTPRPCENSLS